MSARYATFDPLGIDDVPLLEMAKRAQKDTINGTYPFPSESRWSIDAEETMVGEPSNTQVQFSREELNYLLWKCVEGAKTRLENQLERRDYRLIDEVSYRPLYGKAATEDREFSGGTKAEWLYAKETLKPRFFIHDKPQDGEVIPEAFKIGLENLAEANKIFASPLSEISEGGVQDQVLERLFHAIDGTKLI